MGVIPHVHHGHFPNFMNDKTIIAVIKYGRNGKHRIEHRHKHLVSPHQVNQSLRVVKYRPGVMPAVSFGKSIPPFEWRERRHESAVLFLSPHQPGFRIKQIFIVQGPTGKQVDFRFRTLQFLGQLIDTPVIIGIFQRTGRILMDVYITGHIA